MMMLTRRMVMMLVKMTSKVEVSQSLGQSDQSQQLVSKHGQGQLAQKGLRKKKFHKKVLHFEKTDYFRRRSFVSFRLQCGGSI